MNTEQLKELAALPAIEEIVIESENHEPVIASQCITKTRYEAHYNDAGRVVWRAIKESVTITPDEPGETKLNRAQRRSLAKYIARKAATQMAVVRHRHPEAVIQAMTRCPQCHLYFLGSGAERCQCKATIARR